MRHGLRGGQADVLPEGRRVSRGRWLGHQILDIIAADTGVSFEELAERTGASYAEVKAAVWRLYGMKRADLAWGYVVAVPSADEGRRAA